MRRLAGLFWQPMSAHRGNADLSRRWQAQAEMVSLVSAVCLAVFVTKLILAYQVLSASSVNQLWNENRLASLSRLAACCAEDIAVGLACLLLASLAFALSATRAYRGLLRILVYSCALIALALMAVNAQLFATMRCFLTATEVQMALGFNWRAYLGDAVTVGAQVTTILLLAAPLAIHLWWLRAWPGVWEWLALRLCRPIVLVVLIAGFTGTAHAVQNEYFFATHPDFAQNVHLLLARSYFQTADAGYVDEPPFDVSDFQAGQPRLSKGLLTTRPQNVILIVLESVATPYLDLHGGPFALTPNIQKLKKKGLIFDNFYSTSNHSLGSSLPLFGSTYNDPQYPATVMRFPDFPVPSGSTWLKKQGYKTYFLGAAGYGIWEGFHSMVPIYIEKKFDVDRNLTHPFWSRTPEPDRIQQWEYQDKDLFADAHRVLDDVKDEKFFLMMWNYGTHYPYTPEGPVPPKFDERFFPPGVADSEWNEYFVRFLQSIYAVDAFVAKLYADLERRGLADKTLIAITGDHGETFGQHLGVIHGHSVHEEEVHVPLILLNSHIAHLGPRSNVVGSHIDLWPTLMDICGLPCDPRWQGRSLLGGKPGEERRAYFASRSNRQFGLRQGNYKYIWDGQKQRPLLFDLATDPEERNNLAPGRPEWVAEFHRRVTDWRRFMAQYTIEKVSNGGS